LWPEFCPTCESLRRQAGPDSQFSECRRCNQSYIISGEERTSFLEFCPDCRPVVKAECLKETRLRRISKWPEICPSLYRDSDRARLPQKQLAEVEAWRYGPQGLLLHGETGKGKSRCAWILLRRLYVEEDIWPKVFNAADFAHAITKNFNADANPERWLENVCTAKLVFFDDFGKCRLTERGESELFGIIEYRMAAELPVIITTNFMGESLAGCMRPDIGVALVRRLRESSHCIAF
jgi:hypothetical protein